MTLNGTSAWVGFRRRRHGALVQSQSLPISPRRIFRIAIDASNERADCEPNSKTSDRYLRSFSQELVGRAGTFAHSTLDTLSSEVYQISCFLFVPFLRSRVSAFSCRHDEYLSGSDGAQRPKGSCSFCRSRLFTNSLTTKWQNHWNVDNNHNNKKKNIIIVPM